MAHSDRTQNILRRGPVVVFIIIMLGLAVTFGRAITRPDGAEPTQPENGLTIEWVQVENRNGINIVKGCDGTTLVYWTRHSSAAGGGIAVIPNSEECP